MTRNGGYLGHETPDGKWLYFTYARSPGIWRIASNNADGGPSQGEDLVIGPPYTVQAEGWSLTRDQIVFIDRPTSLHPAAIRAFGIATRQMRSVLDLAEVFPDRGDIGVSVSPDSRWVLYAQLDRSGSNVIVADNLR